MRRTTYPTVTLEFPRWRRIVASVIVRVCSLVMRACSAIITRTARWMAHGMRPKRGAA